MCTNSLQPKTSRMAGYFLSMRPNYVVCLAIDNALSPDNYIILSFLSSTDNKEYGLLLSQNVNAFRKVHTPIDRPGLPASFPTSLPASLGTSQSTSLPPSPSSTTEDSSSFQQSGNEGLSTGALVGIVISVFIVVALAAGLVARNWRKDNRSKELPEQREHKLGQQ